MKRETRLYIDDIMEALERIEHYTGEMDFGKFSTDQKTVDAVVRNFEVIGEATKQLSNEFKSIYPDNPWKEMAGMRDKLIHAYFGINLEILWKTITTRVPDLQLKIQNILKDIKK